MKETQHDKFLREIMGSDMEFYDQYLSELSDEEMQRFLEENPNFLKE